MASPPGTKTSSAGCGDGKLITFIINYDETTRALLNRSTTSQGQTVNCCVLCVNPSSSTGVLKLDGAAVDLSTLPGGISRDSIAIPAGTTALTVAQLNHVGFNVIEDVGTFGLGC
jgi:hypothetical protein